MELEYKIPIEHFEDTKLDILLNKTFGKESPNRLLYRDIERTYSKYLSEKASRKITIITDKIEEQDYKYMGEIIKIRKS